MILYHFHTSPYARRVRCVLAMKGLDAELRDTRAKPELAPDVERLNPLGTVPVLVDGERVIADSAAIVAYLDRKVPDPPVWPADPEAAEILALIDGALRILVDLGARYHAFRDHAAWEGVRAEHVGRAQKALDAIAARVKDATFLFEDRWTGADIAVYTAVEWMEGLPARAATAAAPKNILALGWSVPASLSRWAAQHRERAPR